MRQIRNIALGFCLFLAFGTKILALQSDKKEKVFIASNSCTYNYKNGTSLFEGDVKVDQGSTHIRADRLTTKNNIHHEIEEATAFGLQSLAHYWTLPKTGDLEIHGLAKIIKFYPVESNVTLEKEVQVKQGENSFRGQLIHYNMSEQTITVPPSKNGRAELIYNPDQ